MQYALIKNNKVENIIIANPDFIESIYNDWDAIEDIEILQQEGAGIGIGWGYVDGEFVEPQVVAPVITAPVWEWYIDLGPFYDRFGAAKMPVLTSNDSGVKAIITDLNIRKWVDLKRTDVAEALQYVGTIIPALTPALQSTIINTPVSEVENIALRRLYFS